MIESFDQHLEWVSDVEEPLAKYAKHSFEVISSNFLGGVPVEEFYSREWEREAAKIRYRTPHQIERDRILHSWSLRKMTEKYHVLYSGERRIVRNYTTHAMRMAQVSRALCRGLRLNQDFAEGMALGSKVGAAPFIHASKGAISHWLDLKLQEIDSANGVTTGKASQMAFSEASEAQADGPSWASNVRNPTTLADIVAYMPCSLGSPERAYVTGAESYWLLTTDPFRVAPLTPPRFTPETMYGIWRHSCSSVFGPGCFEHQIELADPNRGPATRHSLSWENVTYEAIVVQYADDITWVIENLADATAASLLNGEGGVYREAEASLRDKLQGPLPSAVQAALSGRDASGLYTYFINAFVAHSQQVLSSLSEEEVTGRAALREGRSKAVIGLPDDAEEVLDLLKEFLKATVFKEDRVNNRRQMLQSITTTCLRIFYDNPKTTLRRMIEDRARLESWSADRTKAALDLSVSNLVHRAQLAVDLFVSMSDQEIYDFVGVHSL